MGKDIQFNHEKLEVYQTSIQFIGWLSDTIENINGNRNTRHVEKSRIRRKMFQSIKIKI